MPITLILANYTRFVRRGSTDGQTVVRTITLTDYVFMLGAIFVINAGNWTCPIYYAYNSRFENLSGSLLFCLPDRRLDVLNYSSLYKSSLQLDNDPILRPRCSIGVGKLIAVGPPYGMDFCRMTSRVAISSVLRRLPRMSVSECEIVMIYRPPPPCSRCRCISVPVYQE